MLIFENIEKLFQIGPFEVHAWGLIFVIAFLLAFFLILKEAKKQNFEQKHIYNIALLILVGTIMGTRLVFVFEHLVFFLQNPLQILFFWQGGLTSYGSLFSVFFVYIYVKKQKLNFGKILDLLAPYIVLAVAIIRIGCFLRGCCHGQETMLPWAVNGMHPTQLYESIYCMVIFFILQKFKKIKKQGKNTRFRLMLKKPGAVFMYFLGLYVFFRFFNDFLRVYETYWLGLALSQWIIIAILILVKIFFLRIFFTMKISSQTVKQAHHNQ